MWKTIRHMIQYGCKECNNSGYYERIGIFEILAITDELKDIIVNGGSSMDIKSVAFENGYRPLVVDGINKVLQGITTLEEIDRNLVIY